MYGSADMKNENRTMYPGVSFVRIYWLYEWLTPLWSVSIVLGISLTPGLNIFHQKEKKIKTKCTKYYKKYCMGNFIIKYMVKYIQTITTDVQ